MKIKMETNELRLETVKAKFDEALEKLGKSKFKTDFHLNEKEGNRSQTKLFSQLKRYDEYNFLLYYHKL